MRPILYVFYILILYNTNFIYVQNYNNTNFIYVLTLALNKCIFSYIVLLTNILLLHQDFH